jgi:hypothetical protein
VRQMCNWLRLLGPRRQHTCAVRKCAIITIWMVDHAPRHIICLCGRPCHCRSHVLDYCHHCGHHGSTCCCHFSSVKATATATTHHRTPTLRPPRSPSAPQHVRPATVVVVVVTHSQIIFKMALFFLLLMFIIGFSCGSRRAQYMMSLKSPVFKEALFCIFSVQ